MSKIIVALDNFVDYDDLSNFIETTKDTGVIYKIGKEMFIKYNRALVTNLTNSGLKVFLDLKLHDIPNTVVKALESINEMGVWMTNIHCSGGRDMITASADFVKDKDLILIGVTVLTSLDDTDVEEIGFKENASLSAVKLALLGYDCGLNGVVCSPFESSSIKMATNPNFITVTPGVRLSSNKADDQKRFMTPPEAQHALSDYLVIGRPITQAEDPVKVIEQIKNSLN